jgi:hypothetical protein
MTNPSDDLSRGSFLKATLAGAAVSLTKFREMAETDQKSQGISSVSGGQSDELTRMSIREASDRCLLAVLARSNLPQVAPWVLDHRPSIAIRLI